MISFSRAMCCTAALVTSVASITLFNVADCLADVAESPAQDFPTLEDIKEEIENNPDDYGPGSIDLNLVVTGEPNPEERVGPPNCGFDPIQHVAGLCGETIKLQCTYWTSFVWDFSSVNVEDAFELVEEFINFAPQSFKKLIGEGFIADPPSDVVLHCPEICPKLAAVWYEGTRFIKADPPIVLIYRDSLFEQNRLVGNLEIYGKMAVTAHLKCPDIELENPDYSVASNSSSYSNSSSDSNSSSYLDSSSDSNSSSYSDSSSDSNSSSASNSS